MLLVDFGDNEFNAKWKDLMNTKYAQNVLTQVQNLSSNIFNTAGLQLNQPPTDLEEVLTEDIISTTMTTTPLLDDANVGDVKAYKLKN